MGGGGVFEANLLDEVVDNHDLLSDGVDHVEAAVGEEDGEGDSGESSAGADVEDVGAVNEGHCLGDGEGVEDVLDGQVLDICAGDEIDLLIPLGNAGGEGFELGALFLG